MSREYPINEYFVEMFNSEVCSISGEFCEVWYDYSGNLKTDWEDISIDALLDLREKIDEVIENVSHAREQKRR